MKIINLLSCSINLHFYSEGVGLLDLLAPPNVSHAFLVQELPQTSSHVQATDGLLRHGHPSGRIRSHAVRIALAALSRANSLGYIFNNTYTHTR